MSLLFISKTSPTILFSDGIPSFELSPSMGKSLLYILITESFILYDRVAAVAFALARHCPVKRDNLSWLTNQGGGAKKNGLGW